jgi:hypothetical protein
MENSFQLVPMIQKAKPENQLEESWQPQVPDGFKLSYLHNLVGRDGVKVISLARTPERFDYTAQELAKAGILATSFQATDVTTARQEELRYGCIGISNPNKGKCGTYGCMYRSEQAIAASHRRALEAAKSRHTNWTAIVEDDMVPVQPDRWNEAFKAAWIKLQKVAPEARLVRLSWCNIVSPEQDNTEVFADAGDFTLSKSLDGVCTGAYMVHREIIPEMLSLFPCCGPVDTCWSVWLKEQDQNGQAHGLSFTISMQLKDSREKITEIAGEEWLGQHGVMYQDRQKMESTKGWTEALSHAWKSSEHISHPHSRPK